MANPLPEAFMPLVSVRQAQLCRRMVFDRYPLDALDRFSARPIRVYACAPNRTFHSSNLPVHRLLPAGCIVPRKAAPAKNKTLGPSIQHVLRQCAAKSLAITLKRAFSTIHAAAIAGPPQQIVIVCYRIAASRCGYVVAIFHANTSKGSVFWCR